MVENRSDTFDVGDRTVHRLGFGAMQLTGEDVIGPPDDEGGARDVLRRAVEVGVDLVDTADSYGPGVSERLIGETIGGRGDGGARGDVLVATKAGLLRNRDGDWLPHGDPDYVRNQVLCSLDRLGTDSVGLYQFHRPDPDTPYEESVQAFAELKDEGLVDAVGVSNVDVDQLETARDHVEVATVQNHYNVAERQHEPVLEACEEYGIGFIPWFPLGSGDLGAAGDALEAIADDRDATPRQVVLAWLLGRSPVTLPIPGTSSVDHLEENVAASELELTDEEIARLDEAGGED